MVPILDAKPPKYQPEIMSKYGEILLHNGERSPDNLAFS